MSHATRRLSLSHVEGASAGAPGGASAGTTGTPEDATDSVSRRHHHHHQDLPLEKRITEESLYPGASDLRELRQEAIDRRGSANAGSNVVGTRGVDSIAPVVENKGDVVIGAGGVADFVDFSQLEDFVETRRQRHHARRVCTNNGGNGGVADSMYSGSNMDSRAELLKAGAGTDVDEKSDYDDEELSSVSPTEEKARINKGFDHDSPPLHARHVPVPEDARFTFFSSEAQTTIHSTGIAGLVRPGESFRDLFARGGGGVWWLDVMDPDREELNAIARAFAIHPLTAEDILTQENREKVELFKNYYFVCFRTFSQMRDDEGKEFLDPINIYMVVFRGGILTFSFAASSSSSANANAEARGEEGAQATTTRRLHHPHARNVRRRIGRLRDSLSLSSDWVCYAMIDDIVDSFGPVMRDIETETETIEDQVFIARVEDFAAFLSQIGNLRKKVMGMMRLLGGKADVIKGFAKRCNEEYNVTPHGDIGLYLGDIQDHVITMMTNLSHLEKMLSRSYGNYLASLSVKNIMLGNH
ncbi:Mg(2+) transporter, partial [Ascosphaera atra]